MSGNIFKILCAIVIELIAGGIIAFFTQKDSPSDNSKPTFPARSSFQTDFKNPSSQNEFAGYATAISGNTIKIGLNRFRLNGIEAPDNKQLCENAIKQQYQCGHVSHQALQNKISGQTVQCVKKMTDRYGRIIAICYIGEEDLNAWMVKNGYAVVNARYAKEYIPLQAEAKKNKTGIWQGAFETPSEWRKKHRLSRWDKHTSEQKLKINKKKKYASSSRVEESFP